ncbi:unnamed protein product [Musa banksii]
MLFRPAWCWKTEWFLLRSEVKQGLGGRIETDARQCLEEEHNKRSRANYKGKKEKGAEGRGTNCC